MFSLSAACCFTLKLPAAPLRRGRRPCSWAACTAPWREPRRVSSAFARSAVRKLLAPMIYCHWHDIWTTARRNSPRKPLRAVERCGREVIVGYVWGTALPYLTARGPTIAYLENNKKSRISVLAEKHFDGLQGGPADSTTPFAGDSLFFCNSLCNARLWSHPHLRAGPFAYRICDGFCTRFCAPNSSAVRQKVIPAWLPHRTSAVRLPWSEESRVSALLRC